MMVFQVVIVFILREREENFNIMHLQLWFLFYAGRVSRLSGLDLEINVSLTI